MDPNEEYKRHENCADELYLFLDDKQNAPSTSEEAVAWGDNLKEIVKSYNITALLGIIDSATNALLESSDIAKDYRAVKSKLDEDIKQFMKERKDAIFKRADRLGISVDEPIRPFIEAPFRIVFKPGDQENDIYINDELVELHPNNHTNNQWNPLLTKFILEKRLTVVDVEDATHAYGAAAIQSAVSKLRIILRYNNRVRDDGTKVDIAPFSRYSQTYKIIVTETK